MIRTCSKIEYFKNIKSLGPWQEEEDEKLLEWVKNNGPCKWSICAENIQGRSGKQCRERWFNNLNPNVKKGGWTQQED